MLVPDVEEAAEHKHGPHLGLVHEAAVLRVGGVVGVEGDEVEGNALDALEVGAFGDHLLLVGIFIMMILMMIMI